jgi:hypothetical protein
MISKQHIIQGDLHHCDLRVDPRQVDYVHIVGKNGYREDTFISFQLRSRRVRWKALD